MHAAERVQLARRTYREAIRAARARSTAVTWRRLVRASWNVRDAERAAAGRPARRRRRPVVLLVEDDAATRLALRDLMVEHGLTVWSAADGHVALDFLRRARSPPSVILLDLVLPGMTGWELRARLLGDRSLARVPVIAMTGHPGASVPGVPTFEKPFDPAALIETLTSLAS